MDFAARIDHRLLCPLRGPDKLVLRRYLQELQVPAPILKARKMGLNVPVARLLRQELRPLATEMLDREADTLHPFFKPDGIRNLWQLHLDGRIDAGYLLWALLTLSIWWKAVGSA